ncbi:MAG: alpha-amylase family glycosyl hydrolase [bacterium]|nr:alpha-amylase family glycosyl hydrolase [bacterium]
MHLARPSGLATYTALCVLTPSVYALSFVAPSPTNHFGHIVGPNFTSFRVWGPDCSNIYIMGSFNNWVETNYPLAVDTSFPSGFGGPYWSIRFDAVLTGHVYRFVVYNKYGGKVIRLDPWTKHVDWARGGSEVIDTSSGWTSFTRPAFNEVVLYELHPGTFRQTFDGIARHVDYLKHLGINAIQLMPSAEFGGESSWGYNPEGHYAPESVYGGFHGWRRMVNTLHSNGIAVLNDVVYNHCDGGDFLWQWNGVFTTYPTGYVCGKCYQYIPQDGGMFYYPQTPQGSGDEAAPWNSWHTYWGHNRPNYSRSEVRWFLRNNVLYWLNELRADGLRVDSTITMRHLHWDKQEFIPAGNSLLKWMNASRPADALMIAEDTQNDEYITRRPQLGEGDGCGFDSQWHNPGVHALRWQMKTVNDADRDMAEIRNHIIWVNNGRDIALVKYISCHDENANGRQRLNVEIDYPAGTNYWAWKKSLLGAGIIMTAVGIPMMFQGDELLMDKWFSDSIPLDWSRLHTFGGICEAYRGLIHCRRNLYGTTRGLTGAGCFSPTDGIFLNHSAKVLAFTRYYQGNQIDDVLVIINASNTTFPSYILSGYPFCTWTWYLQYTTARKCYEPNYTGGGIGQEAKTQVSDGNFYLAPYSVNIYALQKLPPPTAKFVVSETNGVLPRLVRFQNRCTSLPRWYRWDITGAGGYTNVIQPYPNPQVLFTNPGPYTVKLSCYVQADNVTEYSASTTMVNVLHFTPGGWVNGAFIPSDKPAEFVGPLASATQDTATDWTSWDTLAAVRVYTNAQRKLHISITGSLGQDHALVLLLDTDAARGTNVLLVRGGCTELVRNMAGMRFDTDFTPDKAFVLKPASGPNPELAWLDYSDITRNQNTYLGTMSGFASGASEFSNSTWQVGFYNAMPAGGLTGSAAATFSSGIELVAPFEAWDIYTTNLKLQVILTSRDGWRSCNQSLPGVGGNTTSNAASGYTRHKNYAAVAGRQYLSVPLDPGISINHPPDWQPLPDQAAVAGSLAEFYVHAVDVDGDLLTLSCSDPARFTDLGGGVGRYSWYTTPSDVGTYFLRFFATDTSLHAATQTVTLYIAPPGMNTNIVFDGMNIVTDFLTHTYSVFQNTPPRPDWGPTDYLAGLRIITNSQQLILGLSGTLKHDTTYGNNGIAILFDTDPATGSNVLPNLPTTTYRARNMAGMTLDVGFTPDYVLTIGLQNAVPPATAWADFSRLVAGGHNHYFGELKQPVTSYGTIYAPDYMLGFHIRPVSTNLALAAAVDTGLELALTYGKLNVKTNFIKLQVIEINNDGSYYSNQSLPPINNHPYYNGGPSSEARFDLIPGDQHITITIPLVTNFNRAPILQYIGNKTVLAGRTLSFNVTATDEDGTVPHLLVQNLPPGAQFTTNGASGTFTWHTTLADLGSYDVTFRAFDGQLAASETITILVAQDRIYWCNLQWPPVVTSYVGVLPGQPIYGRVHIPTKTAAAGLTPGLSAQLGFGTGADPANWTWINAAFAYDVDGNDEFQASFGGANDPGTYYYAYRYLYTNQGTSYVYGTLDGGPYDTVDLAQAGRWTVLPLADDILAANLQWPPTMTTEVYEIPPLVYGRVWIPGNTSSNFPALNLTVHAGVGASATDLVWYPAWYNTNYGAYNEFFCQFPATNEAGTYLYGFRYVYKGTTTVYGLRDGKHTSFVSSQAGTWVVLPEPTVAVAIVLFISLCLRVRR